MEKRPPIRVAVFATHPIQYQVPWFHRLAARPELDLKVFYGMVPDAAQQGIGFEVPFQWDIPLLEGYSWTALENVSRRPGLGTFSGCSTPGVRHVLQAWRPEVAILTGWHSLMLVQALWACMRLRVPRIVRGDSNTFRLRSTAKRIGHKMLMKGYNYFLAVGKTNREFYEWAGVPSQKIFNCPHFVDNERFSLSAARLKSERASLRAKWGIPENASCFVFAGKLIAKKRPLDLLMAVAKAWDQGASVHVLIVGTGESLEEMKSVAEQGRLPITFAGFLNQSEIPDAYVVADCLVLPSAGETWGLVVNEAMACGRPAIVSDLVGCGPDLIIEGQTGGSFPCGDVTALTRLLVDFSSDRAGLRKMGQTAQKRVLSEYSVDRAVEGTVAAIRAAVGR